MWGKKWFCNQMADLGNVPKGGYNNSFIYMVFCNVILLLLHDRVCFTFSWIQAGPCDALDQWNVIKVILCDFWGCSLVMFQLLFCFLGALSCPVTGPGTLLEKTQGGALSYMERGQTPAVQESQWSFWKSPVPAPISLQFMRDPWQDHLKNPLEKLSQSMKLKYNKIVAF